MSSANGVVQSSLAALLLLAGAGCEGQGAGSDHATISPAALDRLTEHFGCDENFVARDRESTIVLGVRVPGLLKRALEAELPYREELEVGPGLDVRMERGADLDHWCTDLLVRPPRIDATWAARGGRAVVTVLERPPELAGYSRVPTPASVELIGIVLKRPDTDQTLEITSFKIEATIGEPAGG